MPVVRITQFKIPEPQDVDKAIEAYKVLESTALKVIELKQSFAHLAATKKR